MQCIEYDAWTIIYIIQCILYNAFNTMHTTQCIEYEEYNTIYGARICTWCDIEYTKTFVLHSGGRGYNIAKLKKLENLLIFFNWSEMNEIICSHPKDKYIALKLGNWFKFWLFTWWMREMFYSITFSKVIQFWNTYRSRI